MKMQIKDRKELIRLLFDNEILPTPEIVKDIENSGLTKFEDYLNSKNIVLTDAGIAEYLNSEKKTKLNVQIIDPKKTADSAVPEETDYNVEFIDVYREICKKREIQDFVKLFNHRYKLLSEILRARKDLPSLMSINKINAKSDSHEISIIGMVTDIRESKNKHKIIEVEDPTGKINVLINKNNHEVFAQGNELVLDEVVAITGRPGDGVVFCKKIFFPDVPLNKEFKKSPDMAYAIVISDFHVGSKTFMAEEFEKMLGWICGDVGNDEQRAIASKIKYVLIPGDIIDGVGVFPSQRSNLEEEDVTVQYKMCADLLKKIPKNISIIICPGNHDPLRLAEPQPPIMKEFAKELAEMPNVFLLSNPGLVRIHRKGNFPGFDVLFYHGYSYFYYADKVESLRKLGGASEMANTMRFLLQKRHLAPTHTSTQYIPDPTKDPLVIKEVPDFIVSGHVHKASVLNYRNVSLVCGSCWDGISEYALKFGSLPEPARLIAINLQTREIRIMKFIGDEKDKEMKANAKLQQGIR